DLDLGAQPVDVLAHRADTLPLRFGVPYVPQQLLAREHLARRRAQERQQVELAPAQLDVLFAHAHLTRGEVELQLRDGQRRWAVGRARATQDRADTRHELARGERLHDVVVGAELETHDAVGFVASTAQNDHGNRGVGAHSAQHVESAHFGQTEV